MPARVFEGPRRIAPPGWAHLRCFRKERTAAQRPAQHPLCKPCTGRGANEFVCPLVNEETRDIRTLSLALTNTKNQPAGRVEIVQTLTRQGSTTGTAVKVVVLTLPRGVITATGQTEFADFTDPQGRPRDLVERLAITGGTGAYRGASGQIDVEVLPNFTSRWTISLDR